MPSSSLRAVQLVTAHVLLRDGDGAAFLVPDRADGSWSLPGAPIGHGQSPAGVAAAVLAAVAGPPAPAVGATLGRVALGRVREIHSDVTDRPADGVSVHTLHIVYDAHHNSAAQPDGPAADETVPPSGRVRLEGDPARLDGDLVVPDGGPVPLHGAVPVLRPQELPLARFTAQVLGLPTVPAAPVPARAVQRDRQGDPPKVQRAGVYAMIVDAGWLLVTRYVHTGTWSLPGGGIDHGEAPLEALSREVREETGLQVRNPRLADVGHIRFTAHSPQGELEDFHGLQLVYRAEVQSGARPRVVEIGGTTDEVAWVGLNALDGLSATRLLRRVVDEVLPGHR
ncbi:MAG TPA: NUDIX domain-containing protein [Kineosporiaceae bacterium]|nr:NUDIX domain-containing protein [Kineosporiaceae bacterium]